MKFPFLTLLVFATASLTHPLQAVSSISLSTFGSNVEASSGWTWTSGTSTLSGTDAEGELLFPNDFSGADLTTLNDYGGNPSNLRLELTGLVTTQPGGAFAISLEDSSGNISLTSFLWSSFTTSSSNVITAVNTTTASPGFLWNDIAGWTLDSGGSGNPVNATFTQLSVTAVPEPSTYALLALSGLALGGYAMRRRRRA